MPDKIRQSLAQYSRKIARHHFVMGAMGNICVRARGRVWIKMGGAWLERAQPRDFLKVGPKNKRQVSKEINLHMGCYTMRPDIHAVIHTHPLIITAFGTVLSKKRRKKVTIGRDAIGIITFYKPGSRALAHAVRKAIKTCDAVIMANHGLVVVGKDLKEAYQKTVEMELSADEVLRVALR